MVCASLDVSNVAIVSALLSLFARQLGSVLRAVFGWSTMALFSRLSAKKQTGISVALLLSALRPLFVVGSFYPRIATWAIAFVSLYKLSGALNGYPLAVGYFCAFVVTVITVPLVKIERRAQVVGRARLAPTT